MKSTAAAAVADGRPQVSQPILAGALIGAMTSSTFQLFALAVLAPEFLADFGFSRAELGLIGSLNTLVGGLSAPMAGRLTDRIGPRAATVATIVLSSLGAVLMAMASSPLAFAGSAIVLGIPQGWGNPATNALIAERVPTGFRGVMTGIKQSGVQFAVFLCGFTLPTLARLYGWRGAVWIYAAVFAVLAALVVVLLPAWTRSKVGSGSSIDGGRRSEGSADDRGPVGASDDEMLAAAQGWIRRIALFALLSGTVGSVVGRFFPLWAQESVGLSSTTAGLMVALGGLIGMGARVVAGQAAERSARLDLLLSSLAVVGALYCLVLALTPIVGVWVLWPATVLSAVGIGAWNAVAMVAVIMAVPATQAGRASGPVMLGFLVGLSLGAPVAGYLVDRTGTYQPIWLAGAALLLVAAVAVRVRVRPVGGAPVV